MSPNASLLKREPETGEHFHEKKEHKSSEETTIQKDTCAPMFIAALFTTGKTWMQPKCPLTEEWLEMCCTQTDRHTQILLSHEKE